jgi:hypothetical protein
MTLPDESDERRRGTHLLVSFAIVAAFTIAAWGRLSLPFSTTEAVFVHEALRASGQASTPDFSMPDNPVPAQVLGVIQQLVGTSERALRLVFLLLLVASAWVLAELLPRAGLAATCVLTVGMLGYAMTNELVLPQLVSVFPAALAILAAPIGRPTTNLRAILGIAGALALGALGLKAALNAALILVAIALVLGTLLDRLTAVVTAAVAVATAWALGRGPALPNWSYGLVGGRNDSEVIGIVALIAFGGLVIASLVVNDGHRRQRVALFVAAVASWIVVYFACFAAVQVRVDGPWADWTDVQVAFGPSRIVAMLLLAHAVSSLRGIVQVVAVAIIAAALVFRMSDHEAAPRTALGVLSEARAVAQPGVGLAVGGPDRVSVAVYARLGNAPSMPVIYMPEDATSATLAEHARKLEVQRLWLFPALAEPIEGFSRPESRPASAKLLMPLVLD